MSAELIIKRAQHKCKAFYYSIHTDSPDDNHLKMPHGKAQFAAACLYAAVLEFEQTRGYKTPATLPVIIESAQWEVDRNWSGVGIFDKERLLCTTDFLFFTGCSLNQS